MKALIEANINSIIYTVMSKKSPLKEVDRYGNVMHSGETVSETTVNLIEIHDNKLCINRKYNSYNNTINYDIILPLGEANKEVVELEDGSVITLSKERCREISRKQLVKAMEVEKQKVIAAQALCDKNIKEIRSRYFHTLNG